MILRGEGRRWEREEVYRLTKDTSHVPVLALADGIHYNFFRENKWLENFLNKHNSSLTNVESVLQNKVYDYHDSCTSVGNYKC